jgi:MFS family permease
VNYIELFRNNQKILLFGILLTFFSSFGQTFVLSLYIPWLLDSFNITRSFYSGLYALATLSSAATLIFVGRMIDHLPLTRFTWLVLIGIFAACLLAAFSPNLIMLFLAIYMLRFFGQGLLTHTSMTTISRYFNRARGKALSIAYLGFPIGEGLFPVIIVAVILWIGWRQTFFASSMVILFVLIPLAVYLLKGFQNKKVVEGDDPLKTASSEVSAELHTWSQRQILKSAQFILFAPTVFLIGFLLTALFFFQTFIADYKGWSVEWMAGSILAYAISSFLSSIAMGPLVDRLSARKLFPFILLPLALGLSLLGVTDNQVITPIYWLLVGITAGSSTPVISALYAETYGIKSLGAVRSLFTFVMVISTALGPVVYSIFLERGFSFTAIHWGVIVVIILNVIFTGIYKPK